MTTLVWRDEWGYQTRRARKQVFITSCLFLGSHPVSIAQLDPSSSMKQVTLWTDLPITTRRSFGPLDEMKAEVTELVLKWLSRALLSNVDFEDGSGI